MARGLVDRWSTVVEVLRDAAAAHGDVEAYVEPATATASSARRALSFGEWDRAADGVAGLLAGHGVGRGDVVCLFLPPSADYAICYAAAARLGAITTGVNLRLGPAEQASVVARTHPVVTVVDTDLPDRSSEAARAVLDGAGVIVPRSVLADAATGRPPALWPTLDPSDPVAVVWTSGTTGLPKGAVFDHRNLAAVAAGVDVLSRPGDRRLSPLPFAHVGYMTRQWEEIANGLTTVISPTPWTAADTLRILGEERVTVAQGVPTQWALLLALPELADTSGGAVGDLPGPDHPRFPDLRLAATGGSRVPPELVAAMRATFGVPVVVRYTSTEASLGTGTRPGDPDDVVATTVGKPVAGVEMVLVADSGEPVATGEVGRVRLRSGAVFRGYWGGPTVAGADGVRTVVYDDPATAPVLSGDGWVTTGDYGRVGEDGNLRLVGRANELYIRGGYNVYPAEVEGALGGHPDVAQVAVVGTPDPVLGEIGVAFVVPADPSDPPDLVSLRNFARDLLADYKRPDRLVVLDQLPLTAMSKVDRRSLAARAAELID